MIRLVGRWLPYLIFFAFLSTTIGAQSDSLPGPTRIRSEVDVVLTDVLVAQRKTGRIVGDLKKEDFILFEENVGQEITHFSHDQLPLSVVLLVDRGGCLDPFGEEVRAATREALQFLKAGDEVALMSFGATTEVIHEFTQDRTAIAEALEHVPEAAEGEPHCYNRAFYEVARYLREASQPNGRRAIIVITATTTHFDCPGPSATEARDAILESGAVVCGLIPRSAFQQFENGVVRVAGSFSRLFKIPVLDLKKLAEESGGEIFSDKAKDLRQTFTRLIDRLRTRYTLGFVSSNTPRDGSFRRLKVTLSPEVEKREGKLMIRSRRGYIASVLP